MNESEEMRGRLPQGMFTALRDELNMFLADPFLDDDDDDAIFDYICFLTETIERHKSTYKNASRTGKVYDGPPILQPWDDLSVPVVEELIGCSPTQFLEVADLFVLLPQKIVTPQRRTGSLRLALFILLMRWTHQQRSWSSLAKTLRIDRTRMIDLYETMGVLIFENDHYYTLSVTIDVPRILTKARRPRHCLHCLHCHLLPFSLHPLSCQVPQFAAAVREKGGLLGNAVIGFVDGSSEPTCRPSKKAAAKRSKFSTVDVQKYAYCGGKTGAHGLVLQSLTMIDGISIAHVELLSAHDATVLKRSGIIDQLRHIKELLEAAPSALLRADANIAVYGDPAYGNLDVVKRKNKGLKTAEQQARLIEHRRRRRLLIHCFFFIVVAEIGQVDAALPSNSGGLLRLPYENIPLLQRQGTSPAPPPPLVPPPFVSSSSSAA
jgi:hypothetical protein